MHIEPTDELNSYIHGGAWRDPTETSSALDLASSTLLKNPTYITKTLPQIKAFASISYRLSAHPSFPQDPSTTPPTEYRDAKHPDHIRDVETALSFLQNKYAFGNRYILVGHSCGATMAFQSVIPGLAGYSRSSALRERVGKGGPVAILGVAGIYDLKLLRDKHRDISVYQEFIEKAFGKEEEEEGLWGGVSPANVDEGGVEVGWWAGRLAVLARSQGDDLVDASQGEVMKETLANWERSAFSNVGVKSVVELSLQGGHDDHWRKGEELARAIAFTIEELQKMGLCSLS